MFDCIYAGVAQSPDDILNGARSSMARVGVSKSASSAVPNPNKRGSAQGTGASTSTSQVRESVHDSQVANGSSVGVSSTPNELADTLRYMTLESYIPEPWMLQDSNKDSKQLLHLIVVGSYLTKSIVNLLSFDTSMCLCIIHACHFSCL